MTEEGDTNSIKANELKFYEELRNKFRSQYLRLGQ